jgi:hypothetical protein
VEAVMRAAAILLILLVLRSIGTASPASTTARAAHGGDAGGDVGSVGEPTGASADGDDLELAGARVPVIGPPIGAVLSAAYATAGLDRDPGGGWIRRARLAGLMPWLTVRTTRNASWQDQHAEVGHGTSLDVRATWRLDRLVFDSHELRVSAIEAARRRERTHLATRVIRSYFAWRRAAGGALAAGGDRGDPRVAEASAELDALTDGWFSDELLRLKREISATPAPAP